MSKFRRATKQGARLRCAIFGPSGSGKTYSALRMAKGIGGRVAVIDTERRTASKYSDRFTFDVCDLADRTIDGYLAALADARDYDVLIIDSLSHAWQELLREIDQLAKAKFRGNTWSAWSEGTPKQRRLVDALYDCSPHVIATIRSKTEWQTQSEGGRIKPIRVGLAPEQGKGIEYEFDLLLELSTEHIAHVIKDRTGRFQDKLITCPDEQFGRALREWLSGGVSPFGPPDASASGGLDLPPATDGPPQID